MATSLDDIQPLDLASIRDDAPERPPWTSRATGAVALAVVALVFVVVAALVGDRVPLGPGRPLAIVLVAAWALAAVFVAVHRPREPLAVIMALAAFVGAVALLGAGARRARRRHRDRARLRRRAARRRGRAVPCGRAAPRPRRPRRRAGRRRARRIWVLAGLRRQRGRRGRCS